MENKPKKYILRTDRPGKIVPRSAMQSAKQAFGEKVLNASNSFSALKGDLFQDSEQESQPEDEFKILVVSINDNSKVLEVETNDLTEISDDVADLLLPVKTGKERYELFSKRTFMNRALAAELGDPVKIDITDITRYKYVRNVKEGEIKWVGDLPDKIGRHFGIELKYPARHIIPEPSDGTYQKKRHFKAKQFHGIFVTVDQITFLNKPTKKEEQRKSEKKDSKEQAVVYPDPSTNRKRELVNLPSYRSLEVGMRVITFSDDSKQGKEVRGTIKFIGKWRDEKDVSVGIELDSPDGYGDGLYKGAERVFNCPRNHAYFTTADTVLDENSFEGKDDFVVLETKNSTNEKEVNRNIANDKKHSGSVTQEKHLQRRSSKDDILSDQNKQFKKLQSQQNGSLSSKRDPLRGSGHEELEMNEISPGEYKVSSYDSIRNSSSGSHSLGDEQSQERPSIIKANGPTSLQFNPEHFADSNISRSRFAPSRYSAPANYSMAVHEESTGPPSYADSMRNAAVERIAREDFQGIAVQNRQPISRSSYDPTLQIDSMVQVSVNGLPCYGLIKWIGSIEEMSSSGELIAGLELEEPSQLGGDGTFKGKRYFTSPTGRGFFMKLSRCRRDERFTSIASPSALPANQFVEEVAGNFLPPMRVEDGPIGRMHGIQGHHNSCYLDSTLFAMFAFSVCFDSVLYRERRQNDIEEYEQVRNSLKDAVVNPLRKKGFVNAASVLQLRGWLDKLGNVQGFMNEEKDPEEFLMLLLKDVLKVDPFLKIRTEDNKLDDHYFYQILVDRDENNPLPSLQYLIELSFLTGTFRLEEVPSILVVQLPRSGMQKMFKRIKLNPFLDISRVMSSASFSCTLCEREAMLSCRECCQTFGCSNPFVYFCYQCSDFVHQHSARKAHKTNKLAKLKKTQNVNTGMETLELFAVVCIKTSHYVTFAKCGETPNDRWVFFDSMADRVGGENGHNVPEVTECPEVKEWFNASPLTLAESDAKNTPEKVLRLFEDASLCLYRSSGLSMYR